MKRNAVRRSLSLLLALFVALGMTSTVFAKEVRDGDVIYFVDPDKVYVGYMNYIGAYSEEDYDVTLTSVTSSNPEVGKIVKENGDYFVKGIAAGKITVTGNYTCNGKTGSLSIPVTVSKVPKLFKSLKVNGKTVNLKKHPFGMNKKVPKATKVKIKAPANSVWKVKSVSATAYKSAKDWKGAKIKVSKATIQKGKKFKFPKKYRNMIVTVKLVNKKTGEKEWYTVQFYRKTPFAK